MMVLKSITISALIAVGIAGASEAATISTIDQENPGPYETTNGALAPFSFGQSFTPKVPAIDAIKFLLGGDDATTVVRLLDGVIGNDGLDGTIIAESFPVLIDQFGSNFFLFNFPNRVSLVPGKFYVAEILFTSGSLGVRHTQGNQYAGGQFLHQDFSPSVFTNTDLVFAEGFQTTSVPEPSSTLSLLALGLLGTALTLNHKLKPSKLDFIHLAVDDSFQPRS